MRTRQVGSWVLVVLASVLALSTVIAAWAAGLADAEKFAGTATETLAQDDVNQLLAERLVDRFAGDTVVGTSARPAAVALVRGVVTSDTFAGVFEASVRTAHEQLVSDRDDSVTVALAGAAPLLAPAVDPGTTSDVSPTDGAVVAVVDDPALAEAAHLLSVMDTVAWFCVAGWALTSAGALALATDRRRTLRRLASGLFLAGVCLVAAILTARGVVGHGEPADVHAAAAAIVEVFTAPMLRVAEVLAVVGAIIAVFAVATPPTARQMAGSALTLGRRAWQLPALRRASPLLGVLAGLVLVVVPLETIEVLTRLLGLALLVVSTVVLLGRFMQVLDRGRPATEGATTVRALGTSALAAVVVIVLLAGAAAAALASRNEPADPPVADPDHAGCNGLVGLCDRRLDQVALLGSHNSMSSSAEPGWYLGEQRLPISGQLADGVRTLMLDVYPAYVSDGEIRTDLRSKHTADAAAADLTDEGQATLEHLGLTVGGIPPEDADIQPYLCHAYCELGASLMVDKLRDVADFLAYNPNEALIIVLQDYVTAEQTQKVFEEAGLMDRVWPMTKTTPWPTLREMVESRRNLVVLSENHGGELPWLPAMYDVTEETPYEFASPEDFTCAPNRGGTGKPLFLVNHWIREQGRSPVADAKVVNSREELTARLATCQEERGREPGILAVDFVDVGDAVAVVHDINTRIADQ